MKPTGIIKSPANTVVGKDFFNDFPKLFEGSDLSSFKAFFATTSPEKIERAQEFITVTGNKLLTNADSPIDRKLFDLTPEGVPSAVDRLLLEPVHMRANEALSNILADPSIFDLPIFLDGEYFAISSALHFILKCSYLQLWEQKALSADLSG